MPVRIKIVDCSDPFLWYRDSIGKEYTVRKFDIEIKNGVNYKIAWVRADDGYMNLVFSCDYEEML